MQMNKFERYFFSSVASIIINFILGCILVLPLWGLAWTIGAQLNFSVLDKTDIVEIIIGFFSFLVPWFIYNIYRHHIWKKFQKPKVIYVCTLLIPSFCINSIIIMMAIYDYIMYNIRGWHI